LIESGRVYEFQATLSRYRRLSGRRLRCTNALSLSSLQVCASLHEENFCCCQNYFKGFLMNR
jgi:hypothetical protein